MGQTIGTTSPEAVLEDTVDTIHYEFKKHTQALMEIGSLTYEEFNTCLSRLNDLYENLCHLRRPYNLIRKIFLQFLVFIFEKGHANVWIRMGKLRFSLWKRTATKHSCGRRPFVLRASNVIHKRIRSRATNWSIWSNSWRYSTHSKRIWRWCRRAKSKTIRYDSHAFAIYQNWKFPLFFF